MADKVLLKAEEYTSLQRKIKDTHSNLITLYGSILDTMGDVVADGGAISTAVFSPKISSFTKDVRTSVKDNLTDIFSATEQAIDDYITSISNTDAI